MRNFIFTLIITVMICASAAMIANALFDRGGSTLL